MDASESDLYRDQSDQVYYNPGWIAANGTWIHSNNVLFYFMSSPFFDPTSENQQLLSQYGGTPMEIEMMGNKSRMEANLRKRRGMSYVVANDPLESRSMVNGTNGPEPSAVWVIRKQMREQPDNDNVKVLAYYFIVSDTIYQAPSVSGVLTYRLLNTTTALNKIFSTAYNFPIFSASHGHTYVKPVQKSPPQPLPVPSQQSKEPTPMPGTQTSATDKLTTTSSSQEVSQGESDSRTVYEALQMTMRYGKEYSDEMPLLGEPGSFRFSKAREPSAAAGNSGTQKLALRTDTPSHSRVPSTAPVPLLPSPVQLTKAAEKTAPAQDTPNRLKRRKSKAGDLSP